MGVALNANVWPDLLKYSFATAGLATAIVLLPNAGLIVLRTLEGRVVPWFEMVCYSAYLW